MEMKKKTYVRPETTSHIVEVESPLLAASIGQDVKLHDQEVDDAATQY